MAKLTADQFRRLQDALNACYANPFIDDVEDFVFEAIFHYALGLPVPNQIDGEKTKKLFDAVEPKSRTGWSLKTLMWDIEPGKEFELVIQRADVFDKADWLGFPGLSRDSSPKDLGAAVLEHWNRKIDTDAKDQNVKEARVGILLKSKNRRTFYLFEDAMHRHKASDLQWSWTSPDRKGLRGVHKTDDFNVFRWYANQKQLFERFVLPQGLQTFQVDRIPLKAERVVEMFLAEIAAQRPRKRTLSG